MVNRYVAVAGGVVIAAGIGSAVGFAIYSAATAPTKGTILNKDYSPAYSYYVSGYDSSSCYGSGSSRYCTEVWHPGYWDYIPAEYSFDLKDCPQSNPSDCNVGWRDVDPGTYDRYSVGQYYPG